MFKTHMLTKHPKQDNLTGFFENIKNALKYNFIACLKNSAYDPDPLDPQDFGFLDPDPQKYADPRIRIQGAKNRPNTAKKC